MITIIAPDASASFIFFVDLAFKATLLLFLAWAVSLGLRRYSAASRHVLWALVAGALISLPFLDTLLPTWRLAVLPSEPLGSAYAEAPDAPVIPQRSEETGPVASEGPRGGINQHREASAGAQKASAHPSPAAPEPEGVSSPEHATIAIDWRAGIVLFWLTGVIVLLVAILTAHIRVGRLVGRAGRLSSNDPLEEELSAAAGLLGIRRRPCLRMTEENRVPFTCGLWRAVIVLPVEAERWSPEKLRAVLLHELAHIKRRDCLTQFLAQVCVAFYWFHPLAWLLDRRMRVEREKACDDLVLNSGIRPTQYGGMLLEVAAQRLTQSGAPYAALAMARTSSLEGRLLAILDTTRNRRGLTRAALAAGLVLCGAVAVPLASVRLAAKEAAPAAASEERSDALRIAAFEGMIQGNIGAQRQEALFLLHDEQLEPAAALIVAMSEAVESVISEIESEETWSGEAPTGARELLSHLNDLLVTLDLSLDALDEGDLPGAREVLKALPPMLTGENGLFAAESWDTFVMSLHGAYTSSYR